MEQPNMTTTAPATMNRKTRYYYAHKNETEFQNRLKEAKRKYYQANKDTLIQKALDRYYRLKGVPEVATITTVVDEIGPA